MNAVRSGRYTGPQERQMLATTTDKPVKVTRPTRTVVERFGLF